MAGTKSSVKPTLIGSTAETDDKTVAVIGRETKVGPVNGQKQLQQKATAMLWLWSITVEPNQFEKLDSKDQKVVGRYVRPHQIKAL